MHVGIIKIIYILPITTAKLYTPVFGATLIKNCTSLQLAYIVGILKQIWVDNLKLLE